MKHTSVIRELASAVFRVSLVLLALAAVAGCGGDRGDVSRSDHTDSGDGQEAALNQALRARIAALALSGDPAAQRGLAPIVPHVEHAPLEKLGQLLFFSRTLSGGYDVACASCHHPLLAGGDGLSLSVGVAATNPVHLGPGREIDPLYDMDPQHDGGPNVPRNSQTIFNVALYDRALFHDGRLFVLEEEIVPGGAGQLMRSPESGNVADLEVGDNLLDGQARFPLVSNREMRNFRYPALADPEEYRQFLVARLRGEQEDYMLHVNGPAVWLQRFQAAFQADGDVSLISLDNIQKALAAYQRSMIFVDTPWRDYLQGDDTALSEEAKRGALLFLLDPEQGGLGCASCHQGDHFTDELFHNAGFPQIGRGRRADNSDPARWGVTQAAADRHAFRTPGLINVAVTGPYGHAGTFDTLEQLLRYHADPVAEVETFFATDAIAHLDQFQGLASGALLYPHAESLTREAQQSVSFAAALAHLPGSLSEIDISRLVAFLESLTDRCVLDVLCIDQWTPAAGDDPDGHLLVWGGGGGSAAPGGESYPEEVVLEFPPVAPRSTFPELNALCDGKNSLSENHHNEGSGFLRRGYYPGDEAFGLDEKHGWLNETWFSTVRGSYEMAMFAGGVTATYLDDDCWPALVFAAGETSGVVVYRSRGGRLGFERDELIFADIPGAMYTGSAHVDLNGNYRRELFFGNHLPGAVEIYSPGDDSRFYHVADLPMSRGTFGISFGDIDGDGYPEFYLAHWSLTGVPGTAPALWKNDAGDHLLPFDGPGGTSSRDVDQTFNFTPSFADITGDGSQDLLIASDFFTSQALQNRQGQSEVWFDNVTDRSVITDENGMAGLVADFFNDGKLDWFVGSIFDPIGATVINWGETGNRLYRNTSNPGSLSFEDVTATAGDMADGNWSWGSCAADFNNSGFIDIFQVNGFGYIPESVLTTAGEEAIRDFYASIAGPAFGGVVPRLFINNGDGTFTESAEDWGLVYPSEGIGVACLDYDRDGDIDIVLVDQSNRLQFYENRTGHGEGRRFLGVRLVGEAPNTDALGAKVYVTADTGLPFGEQTMLRVSQANSNFNGQDLPDLHFGLGSAQVISELRVEWPNGLQVCFSDVDINQFMVIDQRVEPGLDDCAGL